MHEVQPAGLSPATAVNRDYTVEVLADAYLASYAGRDNSRARYLAEWTEHIGKLRLSELDPDLVADTLQLIAEKPAQRHVGYAANGAPIRKTLGPRKPATINRIRAALGALLTWARRTRRTPKGFRNPVRETEALAENNARVRYLAPDELDRLLKVARASSWPRLYLLILLALTTGARRGELLGLRGRDLNTEQGVAYLGHTKNGQPRTLVLLPAVLAELQRLGIEIDSDLLVFPATRPPRPGTPVKPMCFCGHWKRALREAGIRDFRFHDLRHTAASYMAQGGASLLEIADMLGHRTLDVTKRYAHLNVDHRRAIVGRVLGNIGAD